MIITTEWIKRGWWSLGWSQHGWEIPGANSKLCLCLESSKSKEMRKPVHFLASCLVHWIPAKLHGSSPCKRPNVKPRSSHALGSRTQFISVSKLHIVGLFRAEHAALFLCDKAWYPRCLHHIYSYETAPGRLFHLWKNPLLQTGIVLGSSLLSHSFPRQLLVCCNLLFNAALSYSVRQQSWSI